MTTWAIGDIQGCSAPYFRMLDKISFSPSRDTLWIAGDMVNRGSDNVSVLRHLRAIGDSAKVVLGNHDLHLLATHAGARKLSPKDTLHDVIAADDCEDLLGWLKRQPLLVRSDTHCMTHAGVPAIWSVDKADSLAREVSDSLSHDDSAKDFFHAMYGNKPDTWNDNLTGYDRLRVITNYFTRMRFITAEGRLDLNTKEGADAAPDGYMPWFQVPRQKATQTDRQLEFIFGHWAALEGRTGVHGFHAMDTGCVWGGSLTAMNLATQERVSVPATQG